jgi:FixJ family two-component response regulator
MPGMSGIELQQAMHEHDILLPIIFITGYGDIPTSVKAIKDGAVDFLTKPVKADELLKSVKLAILQSREILSKNHTKANSYSLVDQLTQRECEVMQLAIRGLQNKLIAQKLGISHRTVEIHKSKIMAKTGAVNLLHLAQIARDAGLEHQPTSIKLDPANNTIIKPNAIN